MKKMNYKYKGEFKKVDNEILAYFLGYLYADGCLSRYYDNYKDNGTYKEVIRLSIHHEDKDILYKIQEKYDFLNITSYDYSKHNENNDIQYCIRLSSSKAYSDFKGLGLLERKSYDNRLNIRFPFDKIPKELQHHFVRGYFDGDGSISISTQRPNLRRADICSVSYNILDDLTNWFTENKCPPDYIRMKKLNLKHQKTQLKVIEWGSSNSIYKLGKLLYKNATIFLERKKEKFEGINYIDYSKYPCPKCKSINIKNRGGKTNKTFNLTCVQCNNNFTVKI